MKVCYCEICKNMVNFIDDKGVLVHCCGRAMKVLDANTTDAATEKHVPSVKVENGLVEVVVGDIIHPQTVEHHISFIALETNQGIYTKVLDKEGEPKASFKLLDDERPIAVYEYCNLHGLWKKDI